MRIGLNVLPLRSYCGAIAGVVRTNWIVQLALGAIALLAAGAYFVRRNRQVSPLNALLTLIPSGERVMGVTHVKMGFSNKSYQVQTDKGSYFLQQKVEGFTFSERLLKLLKFASEKQISPEVVCILPEKRAACSRWVENAPWPGFETNKKPYYETMKLLARFHNETRDLAHEREIHAPFAFIKFQGERAVCSGEYPEALQLALERVESIFAALRPSFVPTLIHGDFTKENVLLVPDNCELKPKLIDFDNSTVGEALFDVAKFTLRESKQTKLELLEVYSGKTLTTSDKARFELIQLALLMTVVANRLRLAETAPGKGLSKAEMEALATSTAPCESFLNIPFSDGSKSARQRAAMLALHEFLQQSSASTLSLPA